MKMLIALLLAGLAAVPAHAGFKRKASRLQAQPAAATGGYLDFKPGFKASAAASAATHAVNAGTPSGGASIGTPLGPGLGQVSTGGDWTKTSGTSGHNGVPARVEQGTAPRQISEQTQTVTPPLVQSSGSNNVIAAETDPIDLGKVPVWQGKHGFDSKGRPVLEFRAHPKYSIKFRSNGAGSPNFAMAFGAVAWTVEAGSNYLYKASISKQPGSYDDMPRECRVTKDDIVFSLNPCERCVSKIEFQFNGTSPWMCNLEHNKDYYLNVEGDCQDVPELALRGLSNGEKYGCSLSLEVTNGGVILLNPSGPAEACRTRGWSWVEGRGCVVSGN
ncbi:MAG: hypothetical protein HY925_11205 [Elusimicrobia bacterium]|nr:hypothetical protein [Elusimicrobiota bacterium]